VQVNGGTPTITTYNFANQITNAGYTYDNAGNLTAEGTTTYSYDALSRNDAARLDDARESIPALKALSLLKRAE